MQRKRPIVPKKYHGKWIAWNHQQTKIVASGRTLAQARQAAIKSGEDMPVLAKMPAGLFAG